MVREQEPGVEVRSAPPRMTCPAIRPPARLLALALCVSACTDAPDRPTRSPVDPRAADPAAPSAPPKTLAMPDQMGRRLGVPRAENRIIKPLEGSPEVDLRTAEPFRRGAAAAPGATPATQPATPAEARPFRDQREADTLERLRSGQLQTATKGSSGRTLAFKVALDSGVEGYYKPEQRLASAGWFAELAAFYLDRALDLGRVPPVVSRRLEWKRLEAAAGNDARTRGVVVDREGLVRGALVAWLPEKLTPVELPKGWEDWIRVEPRMPRMPGPVTPYQSAAAYKQAVAEAKKRGGAAAKTSDATTAAAATTGPSTTALSADAPAMDTPAPPRAELPAELSDVIVFDYLTANCDRFESRDDLVTLGDQGSLIFLDNGAAFSPAPAQRALLDARLAFVSKFRRSTIEALRTLDIEALRATMAADSLGPLLDAAAWRAFEVRRTAVLEHVARLEKRFGDAVYAW